MGMQTYRVETVLKEDGVVVLDHLPFPAGTPVEVVVLVQQRTTDHGGYALRGMPITYRDPLEPVAQDDWDALR
jgi:hypothetical protein